MAKKNPSDILTGDWNPIVGCERYSAGCRKCWLLGGKENRGIIEWQQGLGNIPKDLPKNTPLLMEKRLNQQNLMPKNGIVGLVQHSDLFWDKTPKDQIDSILNIVDEVAKRKAEKGNTTKYVLWSKRAKRMADFLTERYPQGIPDHLGCGVSVEHQRYVDERLPELIRIKGRHFLMIEPMLSEMDISAYVRQLHWVVVGSETGGDDAVTLDPNWVRKVRDQTTPHRVPFFVKQLGKDHKKPIRELDGRTWDEFPEGFEK